MSQPQSQKMRAASFPIWIIALATGSAAMGITVVTPALPVIAQDLGASSQAVQQLLTLYLAMLALGQLVIGPLSDIIGRRPFFLAGAALIGVFGLAATQAETIESLLIYRCLQGIGAAASLSMGRAIIHDHFDRMNASKAMATVQTIQAVVPLFALTLGGTFVFHLGWQGIMGLISAAGLLLFGLSLLLIPETHSARDKALSLRAISQSYGAVLSRPVFCGFMLVSALQVGAFFSLNAFIPYAYEAHGVSPWAFGLWFALTPAGYLIGNLCNRYFMIERGLERTVFIGCSLSVLSLLLLWGVYDYASFSALAIALPCMLFGFANGFTVANATIAGIAAAGQQAGTASGFIGAMTMIVGGVGGAVLIGAGAAHTPLIGVIGMLVMVAISACASLTLYRNVSA